MAMNLNKRIVAGALVIGLGACVAAFPWLRSAYHEYNKNRVLAQWAGARGVAPELESGLGLGLDAQPEPVLEPAATEATEHEENLSDEVWEEDANAPYDSAYVLANMEGVITIDKINLTYPILRGATQYNLNMAICAVSGSPEMGGAGNYCLAGHRSRVHGRQFNRLAELSTGDGVKLSNGVEDFEYVVTETLRVAAEDTWVLEDVPGERLLTLITCDYTTTPTGRLIVRCVPAEQE